MNSSKRFWTDDHFVDERQDENVGWWSLYQKGGLDERHEGMKEEGGTTLAPTVIVILLRTCHWETLSA
jgi:hypothetical protein